MRISRKKRKPTPLIPIYRVNEKIREDAVRVLGSEGENLGVLSVPEAMRIAKEQEMDLVEINPKADPPVCKIIEFSHFKYQKEKEVRKQKAQQHVTDIKGIRLSVRIGPGDLDVRKKQAEKFLSRGDKVKTEVILRGRERGRADLAFEVTNQFFALLEENNEVKFEQAPTRQGNKVTSIVTKK